MSLKTSLYKFLNADRPLILVGHGLRCSNLKNLFLSATESHQIPYFVTSHLKGYLPEDHHLYLGHFGFGAPESSVQTWKSYQPDAVLYLGTKLGDLTTLGYSPFITEPALTIQVLNEASSLGHHLSLSEQHVSEIEAVLGLLLSFEPSPYLRKNPSKTKMSSPLPENSAEGLHPLSVIQHFNSHCPENSLVISDIGATMAWALQSLQISGQKEFFLPFGYGAMGSGIGSAIGAKLAQPDRPVFCLTGDVAMLMHGNEIVTAKENQCGVCYMIMNDGGHGIVRHGQKFLEMPVEKVRFQDRIDFVSWAQGLKADGVCITTWNQLKEIDFHSVSSRKIPFVIDIHIDPTIAPPLQSRGKMFSLGGSDGTHHRR